MYGYEVKVTKEIFAAFKKECLKWIDIFGIKNWDIKIIKENFEEDERAIVAALKYDVQNHIAVIMLNTTINVASQDVDVYEEVRKAAFHECCELILAPLRELANDRFITPNSVDSAVHSVICRFENCIFYVEENKKKKV